jgi:hypothetical protein
MSPSLDRLMTTGGDTSNRRYEDQDMSPRSDRLMTTGGDTSDGRCEDHDMSPISDRPMTTGEDTLGEGVRVMIGAQFRTPQSQCDGWYKWTCV